MNKQPKRIKHRVRMSLLAGAALPVSFALAQEDFNAVVDLATGILTIPAVHADGKTYRAELRMSAQAGERHFELLSASPVVSASGTAAEFDVATGVVSLPLVEVNDGDEFISAITAELRYVPGSSPARFELASVAHGGQAIFRYSTFGDEQLWTDQLRMHEVISSAVSPLAALGVGLKVDADALPEGILETVDLNDPATTVALLELDAVVGVRGRVVDGELVSVGITCALCHSDVDDSVMEGIGRRLDGFANRDLNPGAILALSPVFADQESQEVLTSWGPGMYDPRFNQDGINHPVLIPPVYGLQGVALETYTGDGPISYWNGYVGVTQMGGQGSFEDERLGIEVGWTRRRCWNDPIAVKAHR